MSEGQGDPRVTGDCIELRGLRILGRCGVPAAERSNLQPLEIDLDLGIDLSRTALEDVLDRTVDYAALCDAIELCVADRPSALLEHLAHRIAEVVIGLDSRVEWVSVSVRKLRPPVPHHLSTAGVRIMRRR